MKETKTVYKMFFVWDFDKEEQWLNEMALAGWALIRVGWFNYTFEACEPGEYTVRLEMHGMDPGYIEFMEQTGAAYVGRLMKWIYFRKKAEDGPFDIFSDIDSRVAHLDRISRFVVTVCVLNLVAGTVNSFNGLSIGALNLLCATLLTYALGRIHEKRAVLGRDRQLHE